MQVKIPISKDEKFLSLRLQLYEYYLNNYETTSWYNLTPASITAAGTGSALKYPYSYLDFRYYMDKDPNYSNEFLRKFHQTWYVEALINMRNNKIDEVCK